MTLQELHERIGWQLEGRLQWRDHNGEWIDVSENNTPMRDGSASNFRRRPYPAPMPDEVWVPDYSAGIPLVRALYDTAEMCRKANHSATPVRYIRADGIIDGSRLEGKHKDCGDYAWMALSCCEYRFKP